MEQNIGENTEPTKDYKYEVKLKENLYDVSRQPTDSGRYIMRVVEVMPDGKNKRGFFKANLGLRAKDYKATKNSAAHFGEFIAYKLAKKIGLPVCEVELAKKRCALKYSKTGKTVEVPGCISYVDLKPGESFISAANVLSWFKLEHTEEFQKIVNETGTIPEGDYRLDPNNDKNNNNIELIMPAFEAYVKEKWHMDDKAVAEVRQNLINMIAFDCLFANRDRNDDNYGLSTTSDGKVRFYPMFDNEYILGLAEFEEDIQKYSGPRLQEHIEQDLYSVMGVTSKPTKLGYQAMLTAIFVNYPEETKKATDLVMKIKERDVTALLEECEGLSDLHKAYALRIFRTRQRAFEAIINEYVDEHGNIIEQMLPAKKPMELGQTRGGSSGRRKSPSKEVKELRVLGE